MFRIFLKEINSFLDSLIGYAVVGVFLVAMGLLMWVFPETSVLDYGFADMETLFTLGPFVFIFLVPAITMRSFAEERKLGTLEWLLTKPLSEGSIVAGKFLASVFLVLVALAPTVIYYFTLSRLGNPPGNVDTSGVIGSYIGLFLLGAAFCAIGIFSSALVTNQIVAFLLAAFISFFLYTGFESASQLVTDGSTALWIRQLGIQYHFESLGRGLIDSRDLVYFAGVSGMLLLAAKTVLSSRSW
ncbi:MAG: gliding motility-associated ABC transporter permease subunit GldF [Cyclobacteriaceae bacterium]|nr:gliding motility-associated ABC transporter permease subunit GldF [Cyclobacteriaceae bacterium]